MDTPQLEQVPAETLKWVLIILFALLGVAGVIVTMIQSFRKRTVTVDPQPVEIRKAAKRYNHEQTEQRHGDVTRRLDAHEAEIDQLWKTMNAEDDATRKEMNTSFKSIERALGRIEGKLGIEHNDHQI